MLAWGISGPTRRGSQSLDGAANRPPPQPPAIDSTSVALPLDWLRLVRSVCIRAAGVPSGAGMMWSTRVLASCPRRVSMLDSAVADVPAITSGDTPFPRSGSRPPSCCGYAPRRPPRCCAQWGRRSRRVSGISGYTATSRVCSCPLRWPPTPDRAPGRRVGQRQSPTQTPPQQQLQADHGPHMGAQGGRHARRLHHGQRKGPRHQANAEHGGKGAVDAAHVGAGAAVRSRSARAGTGLRLERPVASGGGLWPSSQAEANGSIRVVITCP